jgi:hypothetical protein
MAIKKRALDQAVLGLILLSVIFFAMIGISFTTNYVIAANITNVSVLAKLNVTNTEPNITMVNLDDDVKTPAHEIDLTANGITAVTCNATVWDYNGWQDIDPGSINATLYIRSIGVNSNNDNNDHYTNNSCGRCVQVSATEAGCDCRFGMQYYANYSNQWLCNISINDKGGTASSTPLELNFTQTAVSNLTTVTKLLAIETPETVLDYGNLSVTQISNAIERNVSNGGNIDLNLTLRGFGGENSSRTANDTVVMICSYGNISYNYQRYSVGLNVSFTNMENLSNIADDTNFTLFRRTNDNSQGVRNDVNMTFWRLEIPLDVGGLCNGTIIFGAVERST